MSRMYEQFATDEDREKSGVWLDYGPYRVKIARAGGANKDYQKALERLSRKYRHQIKAETMDNDLQEKLLRQVYAQTVILEWESEVGKDEEGKPIYEAGIEQEESKDLLPVTVANVAKTLNNLPPLFEDIQEQAKGIALWRAALKDEISGNL